VKFSFEDLEVWQKAVDFADKVISLAEEMQTDRKHFRLIEQLESASEQRVSVRSTPCTKSYSCHYLTFRTVFDRVFSS